jgi:predicted RNA-binding Zn ribbon-like protein
LAKRQEAPGRLELVRGYVNSLDLERGTEAFASVAGLRDWLRGAGLPTGQLVEADRVKAVELREAIRSLAEANSGREISAHTVSVLDHAAREAGVTLGFGASGAPELRGTRSGLSAAFGELLTAVALASLDGTWQRMRVCPNPECRWMFYDHSKNRSGRWCQMAECGNRAKVRAYRERTT